uniref:Uncharacterized protein n=1 Tax=Panagrolaimus superbus TaxID=310955 RepID=A0A914Z354_9BILA
MSEENIAIPSEIIMDSEEEKGGIQTVDQNLNNLISDESNLSPTLQATDIDQNNVETNVAPTSIDDSDTDIDKIIFRELKFKNLEEYKRLLKEFPHGFVGILFKEICDNEKGEFYAYGAFKENNQMIGMIIGIRDYAKIRQFTDLETGLAAMTGKKVFIAFIDFVLNMLLYLSYFV